MTLLEFDVIVVGAGLAGLCCAGELVLRGRRPLLISETAEVGAVFPVLELDGSNRSFVQCPFWQVGWGGGWWFSLARRLNLPVRLHPGLEYATTIKGSGVLAAIPTCTSASSLTDVVLAAFPFPIGEARRQIETVFERALAIPWPELVKMDQVLLAAWLEEQGADELVSTIVLTLGGAPGDLTLEHARAQLSVFGGLAPLRLMLCGEGLLPAVYPNIREGLCIPIAEEIERRGGAVWRGTRVSRVLIESGVVRGVEMADGRVAQAPAVAMACGNHRISALVEPLPPEVGPVLEHSARWQMDIYEQAHLLDHPMVPARTAIGVFDLGTLSVSGWTWTNTEIAPWTTEPGKQIVQGHTAVMRTDPAVEARASDEVYGQMLTSNEDLFPGFSKAVIASRRHRSRNGWLSQICVGPKLPRRVESVDGLWFAGDGSAPSPGVGAEAAASSGILAAQAMTANPAQ